MLLANINVNEEHTQYFSQIYQEHYSKLQRFFLMQLDSASEADACVQETIRRFFFFMEDRCWETDMEYIPVYLMRIAGLLCSRRLAEKRVQRSNKLAARESNKWFGKIRNEVVKTGHALSEIVQFTFRPVGNADAQGF